MGGRGFVTMIGLLLSTYIVACIDVCGGGGGGGLPTPPPHPLYLCLRNVGVMVVVVE